MLQAQKPKKVVINNIRRSIMLGGLTNSDTSNPQHSGANSPFNPQSHSPMIQNVTKQLMKITQQMNFYKQKNDQSLIKVRFLAQKLDSYGGLNSIPQSITKQIGETDQKIRKLEELFYFKRSKQMKKIKRRVCKFIELLQFQINQEDLSKIEDQIEVIFLIMDIFTQKYNHLMEQKNQIDQLIQKIKNDTVFNREQLEEENLFMKQKYNQQVQYIRELQLENLGLRKDNSLYKSNPAIQSLVRNYNTASGYSNAQNAFNNSSNSKIYEDKIKSLQQQIESLLKQINKLESANRNYQYEISNYKRKLQESEKTINEQRNKCRDLEQQLLKVQIQQARWKQRYQLMERQKNQRIQLLQKDKKIYQNIKMDSFQRRSNNNYQAYEEQDGWQSQRKNTGNRKINIRKKIEFDPRFKIQDQVVQDSGQLYYDVSSS